MAWQIFHILRAKKKLPMRYDPIEKHDGVNADVTSLFKRDDEVWIYWSPVNRKCGLEEKKMTFHWPKVTFYVTFGQWNVFFFSSSHIKCTPSCGLPYSFKDTWLYKKNMVKLGYYYVRLIVPMVVCKKPFCKELSKRLQWFNRTDMGTRQWHSSCFYGTTKGKYN